MTWTVALIGNILAFSGYLLMAYGYTEFSNGGMQAFWTALGLLVGIRIVFTLLDWFGDVFAYNIFFKNIAISQNVEYLRSKQFPMREYSHDNFDNYLYRIEQGNEYSDATRKYAKEITRNLEVAEELLISWRAARFWDTWNEALRIYSPPETATKILK